MGKRRGYGKENHRERESMGHSLQSRSMAWHVFVSYTRGALRDTAALGRKIIE